MVKYPSLPPLNDGTVSHLTEGWHPAVIVGDPKSLGNPRFRNALYQVLPATSWKDSDEFRRFTKNEDLYPIIGAREGGFKNKTVVLVDQIMTIDLNYQLAQGMASQKMRMKVMGSLNLAEWGHIQAKLMNYFQSQSVDHLE